MKGFSCLQLLHLLGFSWTLKGWGERKKKSRMSKFNCSWSLFNHWTPVKMPSTRKPKSPFKAIFIAVLPSLLIHRTLTQDIFCKKTWICKHANCSTSVIMQLLKMKDESWNHQKGSNPQAAETGRWDWMLCREREAKFAHKDASPKSRQAHDKLHFQ